MLLGRSITPETASKAKPLRGVAWAVTRITANVTPSMGASGEFVPAVGEDAVFLFCALQQLVGIFCNVFVLATVLRKAEMPRPALVFSDRVLVTRRDGRPVLLFRIGNLRCNVIQNPQASVNLFRSAQTVEGEGRVKCEKLDVSIMPLMYGQCVVEHDLEAEVYC